MRLGVNPGAVLPGTGAASFGDAVKLTEHAADTGREGFAAVAAVLLQGRSDEGLFRIRFRGDQPRESRSACGSISIISRNRPVCLVAGIDRQTARRVSGNRSSASRTCPATWQYLNTLLEKFPGFAIFPSSESLMVDALGKGAAGCISATANTHVKEIRALYDGWKSPDAANMNKRASAIRALIASYPLIAAVKATLAEQHKHRGWHRLRPPLTPLDEKQVVELREKLAAL